MQTFSIKSLNISPTKGTEKNPISKAIVTFLGIENDSHAEKGLRQVSLLSYESMLKFQQEQGIAVKPGGFGENLTTIGMDMTTVQPLDIFQSNEVILQVTQIGKSCHGHGCSIFTQVGKCVMPAEGIFCRVLQPGELKVDDVFTYQPHVFKALVITLSDRASQGIYTDKSGEVIKARLHTYFTEHNREVQIDQLLLPDDAETLRDHLTELIEKRYDVIFTTGGTGISERDITVDVVTPFIEKELLGVMEYIRVKYGEKIPAALLSRGIAGVHQKTLLFTLPGSVKAVEEYLFEINRLLMHAFYMIHGLGH